MTKNPFFRNTAILIFLLLINIIGKVEAQELGANFNENIDKVTPLILSKNNAEWVRGFVNIPALCLNMTSAGVVTGVNETAIQNLTRLDNLASAKSATFANNPVKMIFSLKLAFTTNNMGVPAVGTAPMTYLMSAIEKVLTRKNFGANIDILVVGNEPMWETPTADADKFETFTNLLIDKVDSLRAANHWNYEIYAGSLNKASSNTTNAILQKVLKIAKQNPKVAGMDMHEHVTTLTEAENDVRYIRTTQQFSKKLMSTEFSLVWLWNAHASDALGSWGTTNGYSAATKVYEWLNLLIQKSYSGAPVSSEHFASYFNSTSWYPKNWFYNFYKIFKKYNFSQLTYGIQNLPVSTVLTATSDLWTVNFICNGTYLGLDSDKLGNRNPLVYPNYKTITDSLLSQLSAVETVTIQQPAYRLSPVPAHGSIRIDNDNADATVNIRLYDIQGTLLQQQKMVSLPYQLTFKPSLTKGNYLLCIDNGKSIPFTQKICIE